MHGNHIFFHNSYILHAIAASLISQVTANGKNLIKNLVLIIFLFVFFFYIHEKPEKQGKTRKKMLNVVFLFSSVHFGQSNKLNWCKIIDVNTYMTCWEGQRDKIYGASYIWYRFISHRVIYILSYLLQSMRPTSRRILSFFVPIIYIVSILILD